MPAVLRGIRRAHCRARQIGRVVSAATFDGRPTYKEGKALGYFIWRDGNTWKLRWMTFGAEHRFNGRDGEPGPLEVEVGRDNFKPGELPLHVRLK